MPSARLSAVQQAVVPEEVKIEIKAKERPIAGGKKATVVKADFDYKKTSAYVHSQGIVEYEAGAHTKWSTKQAISLHTGQCVTMTENGVIITGGEQPNFQNVLLYDGKSVSNDAIKDMNYPHQHHCAILLGDELFVISGSHTDKVEAFDLIQQQWNPRGELVTQRSNATAALFENTIIVIGGQDSRGNYLDTVEKFYKNTWTQIDFRLPQKIAYAGAIQVNDDEIILYGGRAENERKGERKETLSINLTEGTTQEGRRLEIGGDFSYYQPTF